MNRHGRRVFGKLLKKIDGLTCEDTLESLYFEAIKNGRPKIINLVSENQPHSWLYTKASKDDISKKVMTAKLGWAGKDWKETDGGYLRDKNHPDAIEIMIAVIRVPYSDNPQEDKSTHKIMTEVLGFQTSREYFKNENLPSSKLGADSFANIEFEDIMHAILIRYGYMKHDKIRTRSDKFYDYQNEKSEAIASKVVIDNVGNVFLVSPTRSGKSYIIALSLKKIDDMLRAANKKGIKKILIITPSPDGWGSFNKVFNEHNDFYSWKAVNVRNLKVDDNLKNALESDEKVVIFASWAKMKNVKSKEFIDFISNYEFDALVIDEYHREADSILSQKLITSVIKPKFVISVSATPYNEFMIGVANEYNTVQLTDEELHAYKQLLNLPDYRQTIFTKDFLEDAVTFLKEKGQYNDSENFNWDKLFTVEKDPISRKNVLKYREAILYAFYNIFDPQDVHEKSLAFCFGSHSRFDHVLSYVPSQKAAQLIVELLDGKCGYKMICWTSDYKTDLFRKNGDKIKGSTEEKLNDFHSLYDKTMIWTSDSLAQAVTLDKLSAVFIAKNISSPELFDQIRGRCNNTLKGVLIRETALICPKGVLLKIAAISLLYAMMIYPELDAEETLQKKILRNMNVLSLQGSEWIKNDMKILIDEILSSDNMRKSIGLDDPMFKFSNFTKDDFDFLSKKLLNTECVLISADKNDDVIVFGDGNSKGKVFNSTYKDPSSGKWISEDEDAKLRNKIRNLFAKIGVLIEMDKPKSVDDLLKIDPHDFELFTGISIEILKDLFDKEIISKIGWNSKLKLSFRDNS